jgi:hypothetical protein
MFQILNWMLMHLTIEADVPLHVPVDALLVLYIVGIADRTNFGPAARQQLAAGKHVVLYCFLCCSPPRPDLFAPTLAVLHGLVWYGRTRVCLGLETW